MRTAAEIVDDLAASRGICVPVAAHYPLGRDFAEAAIVAALAELRAEMKANKEGTKER